MTIKNSYTIVTQNKVDDYIYIMVVTNLIFNITTTNFSSATTFFKNSNLENVPSLGALRNRMAYRQLNYPFLISASAVIPERFNL